MTPETMTETITEADGLTVQQPSNGYDPIVGLVQPVADTYKVSFSALKKPTGADGALLIPKTIDFKIMITSVTQQNKDDSGSWKAVALNEKPFDVSKIQLNVLADVDRNEQYAITSSVSKKYLGGFPVRLVIGFKMTNKEGNDQCTGTYAVRHPS